MYLLPLELVAFLEVTGQILQQQEQISQEGQQPKGRAYLRHFFGILAEDLYLRQYIQIIEEPIQQEKASHYDVEKIVNRHL